MTVEAARDFYIFFKPDTYPRFSSRAHDTRGFRVGF